MALQRPRWIAPVLLMAVPALPTTLPASAASTANHESYDSTGCALGGQLPQTDLARIHSAFKTGTIDGACDDIGGVRERRRHATIDVVGNCSANTPRDRAIGGTPHPPFGHLLPSRRGEGTRGGASTRQRSRP